MLGGQFMANEDPREASHMQCYTNIGVINYLVKKLLAKKKCILIYNYLTKYTIRFSFKILIQLGYTN